MTLQIAKLCDAILIFTHTRLRSEDQVCISLMGQCSGGTGTVVVNMLLYLMRADSGSSLVGIYAC